MLIMNINNPTEKVWYNSDLKNIIDKTLEKEVDVTTRIISSLLLLCKKAIFTLYL